MDQKKEQRVCIRFCANLRKSATETMAMIRQAFGEESMSHTLVFEWHAQFRASRTSIEDNQHTGRPISCTTPDTVDKLQQLACEDRCQTTHDLAVEMGIGYGTCQQILTVELGMHHVAAKFVPRILTADQKQQHVNTCEELRQISSDDSTFLSTVITGDESWIYGYGPETKQQSSQWKSPNSPRPKNVRHVKSRDKSVLIIFFDIVHKEFIQAGKTVNSACYCDVLLQLHENVRRLWPEL
jgi:hypothetical protein